jgi:hypothetical protein
MEHESHVFICKPFAGFGLVDVHFNSSFSYKVLVIPARIIVFNDGLLCHGIKLDPNDHNKHDEKYCHIFKIWFHLISLEKW